MFCFVVGPPFWVVECRRTKTTPFRCVAWLGRLELLRDVFARSVGLPLGDGGVAISLLRRGGGLVVVMLLLCVRSSLVFLSLFFLEVFEQFVGPIYLGLDVKASLLAHVVRFKVPLELFLDNFRIGLELFFGDVEDREGFRLADALAKDGGRRLRRINTGLPGVVQGRAVGRRYGTGQDGHDRDDDLGQYAGKGTNRHDGIWCVVVGCVNTDCLSVVSFFLGWLVGWSRGFIQVKTRSYRFESYSFGSFVVCFGCA